MTSIPVRRTPGRPSRRGGALETERDQEGYYEVDRLVRLFLRNPGQPLQWKVIDAFDVDGGQIPESAMMLGQVIGLRVSDEVYKWSVQFGSNEPRDYEVEELARAVNRAHNLRVRITD
ncbi:hypothetical protein P3T76_005447 [Phytophthora citrophthora]|uniref:Uncharacterized protein n=1 Tax=Phytophthora citrophthora TaxID=4793 RepID=A0AAD9GQN0_9STRA|nr:hypothetical protein P3T76_005447 [Phytophthora citrophthora]